MVALDPRHKSHNIPGKFLTYMQSGLPVLANINAGNDLAEIIRTEQVGAVSEDNSVETLHRLADGLLTNLARNAETTMRCKSLFARQFSAEIAVKQVIRGLLDAPVTKEQEGRRMEVQVFSAEYLDSLTEQASASARLRQHRNVHADYADPVQRLFNAIEADSYIRPHRHGIAPRAEMMIAVRGQMALIVFSDDGEVVQTVRFGVERAHRPVPVGVEIPPGKWHTVLALQPGSVLLEVKAGPFEPAQPKEFAGWAPEEGSAAAKDYHQYLRSYCSEAGEGVGTRSDSIVDPHFEAVTTG
jgi:cupin fold WbuC family metalloprotein